MLTKRAGTASLDLYHYEGYIDGHKTTAMLKVFWAENRLIVESRYAPKGTEKSLDDYTEYCGNMAEFVQEIVREQRGRHYGLV